MKYFKLGKICDILNGYAFKSSNYTNKGFRVIRITNVQKGVIVDEAPQYYSDKDMANLKKYELLENDILMSLTGNVGRVGIIDKSLLPAALNQRVACLRLKNQDIYYKYLFYYLNSDRFEKMCIENSNGIAQKNLSTVFLKDVLIPVPSLENQKKIVEVLDKAQWLINARKEQIRLMDELIQSVFYEMFGDSKTNSMQYPTCKLHELGKVGSSKRVFVDDLVENGIPFFRGTEVGLLAEGVTISPKLFITEELFAQLKKATGIPQKGDLLMPSVCPDGRIWRVDTDEPFYFKDGRVLWVNVKSDDINSIYLQYALKDKFLHDYSTIASGTTFAELKIFALKDIDILMPNIELQNQYADFIIQVDKLKLEAQKSLDEMQIIIDSMMQKYFE